MPGTATSNNEQHEVLYKLSLENCAVEPIHIPGSIQPHGILLAFDSHAALDAWSANSPALLQRELALGMAAPLLGLPDEVLALIHDIQAELVDGAAMPLACEVEIDGRQYDCIVHGHDGRIIAELELRALRSDLVASFALKAHAAIDRLKRQQTIEALLNMAVLQVRQLTGFDRVMAYRFRHDDSGDVVAEACSDAMEPYLGRRYPASDIPAQARRLYLINTLRLISDVGYAPSPIVGHPAGRALDMSHAVLRSVSPVHIEYLQNMGVQASMSISIIANGRLWGMLACHHLTPHQVPYSIRMAADVMAQVLASTVQSIEMREQTATIVAAAETSSRLLEALGEDDNVLRTIGEHAGQLCKALEADALIVSEHGKVIIHGDVAASLAAAIVAALPPRTESVYQLAQVDAWPEALRDQLGKWAGVLVMSFDAASQGMLLALRMEQVESVRWGGAPEKVIAHGPLGPRLTPRGSFDEWRSTVRGHAQPWSPTLLTIASQLLGKISRSVAARNADIARARSELMAMLGHDLRDPLQAINMAGSLLEHGNQAGMIGRRIKNSTGRMQRLIGHVLDMSRINGGIGLGMQPVPTTLNRLLAELVDELGVAHPGTVYTLQMPDSVTALVDPDRMVQVLTNLLSNARHHGAPSEPVDVRLDVREGNAVITVKNVAPPIPAQEQERLFDAFKHSSLQNPRNRNGLGLGLYIAHEIVSGHEGTLSYHYEDPRVVFTIVLPQVAPG